MLAVYSSSFALGLLEFGDANYFVVRQVMFSVLGATAMYLLMKSDYRRLRWLSPLLMLAAIVGLFAVLMPGIGHGTVRDAWGNLWSAATHVEDVSPEEMARRAQEHMAKNPK